MLQNLHQIHSKEHMVRKQQTFRYVCVLWLVWVFKFTTVPVSAVHSNLHALVICNPISQRQTGDGQHSSEAEVNFHTISIYKSTGCQLSTDRTSEVFSCLFLLHLLTLQSCNTMSSIFNPLPVHAAEYWYFWLMMCYLWTGSFPVVEMTKQQGEVIVNITKFVPPYDYWDLYTYNCTHTHFVYMQL